MLHIPLYSGGTVSLLKRRVFWLRVEAWFWRLCAMCLGIWLYFT